MEFFIAAVVKIDAVTPVSYVPRVLMTDGAIQWSGQHYYNEAMAWEVAKKAAKSYNEA